MVMPNLTTEQQQQIAQMQTLTKFIRAEVHTENDTVSVKLLTNNQQAKETIPKIQEAMVSSIANILYTLFGIEGKIL